MFHFGFIRKVTAFESSTKCRFSTSYDPPPQKKKIYRDSAPLRYNWGKNWARFAYVQLSGGPKQPTKQTNNKTMEV